MKYKLKAKGAESANDIIDEHKKHIQNTSDAEFASLKNLMDSAESEADYKNLAEHFKALGNHKDSRTQSEECVRIDNERQRADDEQQNTIDKWIVTPVTIILLIIFLAFLFPLILVGIFMLSECVSELLGIPIIISFISFVIEIGALIFLIYNFFRPKH